MLTGTSNLAGHLANLLEPPDAFSRARAILDAVGGPHRLRLASALELERTTPATSVEAKRIAGAFALSAEAMAAHPPTAVTRREHVVRLVPWLPTRPTEELWLITVGPGLHPIGRHLVARGGRALCSVDGVDIMKLAIVDQASGVFLLHNHPSGDRTPSPADRRFTRELRRQLGMVGIEVHDHLVVAGDRWSSCD